MSNAGEAPEVRVEAEMRQKQELAAEASGDGISVAAASTARQPPKVKGSNQPMAAAGGEAKSAAAKPKEQPAKPKVRLTSGSNWNKMQSYARPTCVERSSGGSTYVVGRIDLTWANADIRPELNAFLTSPALRQADGTAQKHSSKSSTAAVAKAEPSGAKDASKVAAAKKADAKAGGKAAIVKEHANGKPPKAATAGRKERAATAAKADDKEGKANGSRVAVKKERKVFELPGQTRETPPEVFWLPPPFVSFRPTI